MIDSKENKRKILQFFLKNIESEGVCQKSYEKSFIEAKIDFGAAELIFENGILDLLDFYSEEIVSEVEKSIKKNEKFAVLRINEKINFALIQLFLSQKNQRLAAFQIHKYYLNLSNFRDFGEIYRPKIFAFKNAFYFADKIWLAIGDETTDFNFYTKRLVLAKVIIRAFFAFLKDESENLAKTQEVIDKEIAKVLKFEKFKAKVKNSAKIDGFEEKFSDFCQKAKNEVKNPKEFIKNLPFIRLFK